MQALGPTRPAATSATSVSHATCSFHHPARPGRRGLPGHGRAPRHQDAPHRVRDQLRRRSRRRAQDRPRLGEYQPGDWPAGGDRPLLLVRLLMRMTSASSGPCGAFSLCGSGTLAMTSEATRSGSRRTRVDGKGCLSPTGVAQASGNSGQTHPGGEQGGGDQMSDAVQAHAQAEAVPQADEAVAPGVGPPGAGSLWWSSSSRRSSERLLGEGRRPVPARTLARWTPTTARPAVRPAP